MLIKTLLVKKKIIKKREAALKNEAGGDEKHVFFFLLGLRLKKTRVLYNKTITYIFWLYKQYLIPLKLICRNRESGKRQGAICRKNSYFTHSPSSRSRENKKVENVHRDRNKGKGKNICHYTPFLVSTSFHMAKGTPNFK